MSAIRRSVPVLLCLGLLAVALAPSQALARPRILRPGEPVGLTLGSSFDVLGVRHFPDRGFDLRFGVFSLDTSVVGGFATPRLSGGLTLGNIVVGLSLEAGLVHINPDIAPDTNVGYLSPVAFFEYWFDGEAFAPFVGAQFGPSITFPDGGDAEVWLHASALGGLHFFVGDSFSIGPTGRVGFVYVSSNERAAWEVVLGFSLRGWIDFSGGGGGGGAEPAPAAEETWQRPPPSTGEPAAAPVDPEAGYQ